VVAFYDGVIIIKMPAWRIRLRHVWKYSVMNVVGKYCARDLSKM